MRRSQANGAGRFSRLNPDRPNAAEKRKRILANDLSRTFDSERDRRVCQWSNRAKLVGNSQNNASGINPVAR